MPVQPEFFALRWKVGLVRIARLDVRRFPGEKSACGKGDSGGGRADGSVAVRSLDVRCFDGQ
jgi:hypothetical protein